MVVDNGWGTSNIVNLAKHGVSRSKEYEIWLKLTPWRRG
jgi:hypothetical protein